MVHHAAWKADEGEEIHQVAAMVKVFAAEMVNRAADRTVQIHGGPIYAEELPVERLCRNATAASTTEYALELQKAIIAGDLLKGV
jgi:acyl-CoA dehydrogenase